MHEKKDRVHTHAFTHSRHSVCVGLFSFSEKTVWFGTPWSDFTRGLETKKKKDHHHADISCSGVRKWGDMTLIVSKRPSQ